MDLALVGKSVIVTGGGSNIGRAISLGFAEEGCHLTIADIDDAAGARTAEEAGKHGAASAGSTSSSTTSAGRSTASSWRRRARSGSARSSSTSGG
jgi:NAD(P)-dependent dehydrogenase (short-subunit alcohol dehydrogenase family)